MKKTVLAVLIAAISIAFSATAYAGTVGTTLDINVTAVEACTVSATGILFPPFDGISDVRADGDVTVTCPSGTNYKIALDGGLNFSGTRNMSNGAAPVADTLRYGLWDDISGSPWGDAGLIPGSTNGWAPVLDIGDGSAQPHTVKGIVYGTQAAPPGAYSDTITVTVHY